MFVKRPSSDSKASLSSSQLFSDQDFYRTFARDLRQARRSIVIESPFFTRRRFDRLYATLLRAADRGVHIVVNTRDPACHDEPMCQQAAECIASLHGLGATVLYTGNLHHKLAMIDGEILWEGSLNIFSQNDTSEVMRRTVSAEVVAQMVQFTRLGRWYNV